MKQDKIFISTSSFAKFDASPLESLKKEGFKVGVNPYGRKLEPEESIRLFQGAIGLIAGTELLSGDVLRAVPSLKIISRCGTGIDNIDMDAAAELKILVSNTPDAPSRAVAEFCLGLILSLIRRITESDRKIRSGTWEKKMGVLLRGKAIGIIGLGRIGKELVKLLTPFDAKLAAYDITPDYAFAVSHNVEMVSLEELLRNSDIVSIHISGGRDCCKLIGPEQLSIMKQGSYIINTSRGGIVDEQALTKRLKDNVAGAALDVFEKEPYRGELKNFDNVILTPHIGSYAIEARIDMEREAVKNLLLNFKKLNGVKS